MTRGETQAHTELKRLALTWALMNGLVVCAGEVRVPKSGYRADVAACSRGVARRTAVFECKQARADLLKDAYAEEATRRRLAELTERRRALEEMFTTHCPDLRRGDALWPEFDTWDFTRLEHAAYRAVLAELETVQRRVIRGTKFSRMFRWRCADFLYLVVEEGIFADAEVPAGWGLLVRLGGELRLVRPPVALESAESQRLALLESIAMAATRAGFRDAGIERPIGFRRFREEQPSSQLIDAITAVADKSRLPSGAIDGVATPSGHFVAMDAAGFSSV